MTYECCWNCATWTQHRDQEDVINPTGSCENPTPAEDLEVPYPSKFHALDWCSGWTEREQDVPR